MIGSRSPTIRTRVVVIFVVAFLILLATLAGFAFADRKTVIAETAVNLEATAARVAGEQQKVVNYAEQLVTILSQTRDLVGFAASGECSRFLARILEQEPRLSMAALVSTSGDFICSGIPTDGPVNVADRAYFRLALDAPGVVIGEVVLGRVTGKRGLPFAKAIRDGNGKAIGVLAVFVDLQWVNREFGRSKYAEGARIGLIDQHGMVLARYPDPDQWVGRDASATPFFKTLLAHQGQGSAEALGFDGVPRLYGLAHFADTAAGPVYLWAGVAKASVVSAADRRFEFDLLMIGVFLIVIFGAIWLAVGRWILRPISALTAAAQRLGGGDRDARVGIPYSGDELSRLAQSFDEMAEALSSTNELLILNRALRVLSSCNQVLIHATREDALLRDVCRILVEDGDYRMAWVGFAEHDEARTVRPVTQYGYESGYLDSVNISWADNERGRGPTGTAIRTAATNVNQNVLTNPAMLPWREAAIKRGYQSSIALPLVLDGTVLGALTIYARNPDAFNPAEVRLLEELAGDLAFGIGTLRARIEHTETKERVAFLSNFDPLTHLPNKLLLRDRFEAALHRAQVERLMVAMLYLDLDNFKQINDSCGREVGDKLLALVAQKLGRCLPASATISRLGGDEFLVLLTEVHDVVDVTKAANAILETFTEPLLIDGNTLAATFSIGIAIYPEDGGDFDALLNRAEMAINEAKESGRNTYRFFTARMNRDSAGLMRLSAQLHGAVKNHEFVLHYQPQIDIVSGRIVGAEALVRWQHATDGLLSPATFIPLAEQTGRIIQIGEWLLDEACREAATWRDARFGELTVAVNLSALQFKRGDIVDIVAAALKKTGLPASRLELELTESILLQDVDQTLNTLRQLKSMGVKLSIDDFGTGYSSLSYLKRLAVDKLKIDQSFIRDLLTDHDDAAITQAIIQLGHSLELVVIAEGVETSAQLAALTAAGCDEAQGYFFSKPVPAAEFVGLLEKWGRQT